VNSFRKRISGPRAKVKFWDKSPMEVPGDICYKEAGERTAEKTPIAALRPIIGAPGHKGGKP
jgi:hypothetical protein